jgi:hypothetical protein
MTVKVNGDFAGVWMAKSYGRQRVTCYGDAVPDLTPACHSKGVDLVKEAYGFPAFRTAPVSGYPKCLRTKALGELPPRALGPAKGPSSVERCLPLELMLIVAEAVAVVAVVPEAVVAVLVAVVVVVVAFAGFVLGRRVEATE